MLDRCGHDCIATAYVPTPSAVEDAGDQLQITCKDVEHRAAELGIGQADIDRLLEGIRRRGHDAGNGLVAVLDEQDVRTWPTATDWSTRVTAGPVPDLGDLLAVHQTWVPHALVLATRTGADIRLAVRRDARAHSSVEEPDIHTRKVQPGGWSQRRFQQRAEEQWLDTAKVVVEHLTQLLGPGEIDLLLLAGEVEMRRLVRDALPEAFAGLVEEIPINASTVDGSDETLEARVDQAVEEAAATRRVQIQQQVQEAVGGGTGVSGTTDVLRALFQGRAETVVVHLDRARDGIAHIGPEPIQVAADAGALAELDLRPRRVRPVDAVLRGAAATDASVLAMEQAMADFPDGLAAALRG